MMNSAEQTIELINYWSLYGGLAILALGLLIIVLYFISFAAKKEYKAKYDFVAKNEIRILRWAIWVLGLGVFVIINCFFQESVGDSYGWIIVRASVSFLLFVLIVYVAHLVFKYTYPAYLDKKLRKLRYKPRISPDGNEMKLLSEDEEDVHLDEGMQAEENIFSVDYDVWVDSKSGHVKIEKYPGAFTVLTCKNCGFHTLRLVKEELLKKPTQEDEGLIKKYYACTYCTRKEEKMQSIASVGKYDSFNAKNLPEFVLKSGDEAMKKSRIHHIRLKIINYDRSKEYYEFQNLEEAKKFMNEYKEKS